MVWRPLSAASQVQELVMAELKPIMKSSRQLNTLARSEWLSELATQSLIAEAELTPKPGLVDGRGSGSHSDLSLDLMRRSADAIALYFTRMALVSAEAQMDTSLRAEVASIGREAEAAMLRATSGSNAHKGAIWVLGLLVCAASLSEGSLPEFVAEAAGYLARLPDRARPQTEAQSIVHEGAARVIKVGGPGSPKGNAALIALGQELISLRISPGGSADLFAATLFLDALERGLEGVEQDNSLVEENDGEN
jgi:triphosphoribosyl-dephospho-CoA synthetase